MNVTDLLLAVFHHLLVFSLAGVLAVEFVLARGDLPAAAIARLVRIDRSYGIIAALIIIVGIGRVFYGIKGWEFYVYNGMFWAKMAAFAAVGLLSIRPTIRFIAWNRQALADPAFRVPAAELASVRRHMRVEIGFFALILIFAAAMARGFGH
jgi:putative membrane protein